MCFTQYSAQSDGVGKCYYTGLLVEKVIKILTFASYLCLNLNKNKEYAQNKNPIDTRLVAALLVALIGCTVQH